VKWTGFNKLMEIISCDHLKIEIIVYSFLMLILLTAGCLSDNGDEEIEELRSATREDIELEINMTGAEYPVSTDIILLRVSLINIAMENLSVDEYGMDTKIHVVDPNYFQHTHWGIINTSMHMESYRLENGGFINYSYNLLGLSWNPNNEFDEAGNYTIHCELLGNSSLRLYKGKRGL
jgi:hypothetical protein